MRITTGKAKVSERELKTLPIQEVKRRAAKAEGRPVPPPSEEEVAQSAARQRLEKLKKQFRSTIESVEVEGEKYFVKRMCYGDLVAMALSLSRDEKNVLTLTEDAGRDVCDAILQLCVCNDDGTPFFEEGELQLWRDEPAAASTLSALLQSCIDINPDIFATKKKG